MPVQRIGIEQIFWQLSRSEEEHWHSYQETTVYMKEHFTTYSIDTGLKGRKLFLTS